MKSKLSTKVWIFLKKAGIIIAKTLVGLIAAVGTELRVMISVVWSLIGLAFLLAPKEKKKAANVTYRSPKKDSKQKKK